MATRYAVASGNWKNTTSVWSDTDGGDPGNFVPGAGDTFVIREGISVLMDDDLSGGAGLSGANTIRGSNSGTPGMLYFKDGTSGYLKLGTDATIVGTNTTTLGRLLANSDGNWATTTPLSNSYTAFIELAGGANCQINADYLDVRLRATHPTVKIARIAQTVYTRDTSTDVDVNNDRIDFGTTPPATNVPVAFVPVGAGTLPGGIYENVNYHVISVSGNTAKLTYWEGQTANIVNITSTGSGTFKIYFGYTSTSQTVFNVLDDVTGDSYWSTTAGRNRAYIVAGAGSGGASQERSKFTTLTAISSSQITTNDSLGYATPALSRIVLVSRNVQVLRTDGAFAKIFNVAQPHSNPVVLNCGILGTDSTRYGITIYASLNANTIEMNGCYGNVAYIAQGNGYSTAKIQFNGIAAGVIAGFMSVNHSTDYEFHEISGEVHGGSTLFNACGAIDHDGYAFGIKDLVTSCTIGTLKLNGIYCEGYSFGASTNYGIMFGGTFCRIKNSLTGNGFVYNGLFVAPDMLSDYPTNTAMRGMRVIGALTYVVKQQYSFAAPVTQGAYFESCGTIVSLANVPTWGHPQVFHLDAGELVVIGNAASALRDTSVYPDGFSASQKITYASSKWAFAFYFDIAWPATSALKFKVHVKHSATGLTAAQRVTWAIMEPHIDPISNQSPTYLASWTAADSTDWQSYELEYTNSANKVLKLGVVSRRASGNAWVFLEQLSPGGVIIYPFPPFPG